TELFNFLSICYNYPPEFNEEPPERNCGSGTYHGAFSSAAGSPLLVAMRAVAFRRFVDPAGGPASAFIDPFFQIDPIWAATHPGYSLAFDPGVGNGPAIDAGVTIPEPA